MKMIKMHEVIAVTQALPLKISSRLDFSTKIYTTSILFFQNCIQNKWANTPYSSVIIFYSLLFHLLNVFFPKTLKLI